MPPSGDVPTRITTDTLAHYNQRAAAFWEGTRDHDVRQNIEALLRHIRGTPPFIFMLILAAALIIMFPQIALFLRDLAFR